MLERHEYKGLWTLPGEDAEGLVGTASVENGRTTLEVVGNLGRRLLSEDARQRTYSLDLEDKPRVLGSSTDGKPITLEGLSELGHTVNMPGLVTARYRADVTVVGRHFSKEEEIAFDEISIRVTDLNAWTRVSGFDMSFGFEQLENNSHAFSSVEFRYEAPADIRFPLSRGEEILIRFTASSKGLRGGTDHVELTQDAALHLRFAKKARLPEVFERVSQVRNFLSLAVGRPVSVLSVSGYRDDHMRGGTTFPRPIELYWEIPHNPDPPAQPRSSHEMLFTLNEAKPEMSTVMRKWFLRQSRLQPVFNLFFGTLYHPSLYLEVKFLAYAQAIETYDYRRRRKHSDKHLAERMKDVLAQCRTVSKRIVGAGQDDLDAFVSRFRDSRNYYTHYSPRLEKKAAKGAALLLLSFQLQAIIEMALLRELGFPCRAIDQTLERARRYERIERIRSIAAREAV